MKQTRRLYAAEDLAWASLGKPGVLVPDGWDRNRTAIWRELAVEYPETIYPRSDPIALRARTRATDAAYRTHRRRVTTELRRRLDVLVGAVLETHWWTTVPGLPKRVTPSVSNGRAAAGGQFARGWGVSHAANPWASAALVVAHELAHVADIATTPGWKGTDHEARYAGAYVRLTQLICGDLMADQLTARFDEALVDYDLDAWPDPGDRDLYAQVADWLTPLPDPAPRPRQLALATASSSTPGSWWPRDDHP